MPPHPDGSGVRSGPRRCRRSRVHLPAGPGSARLARVVVRRAHPPDTDATRGELIVTELVANAIDHAGAAPELVVECDDAVLRLEVRDDGPGWPRIRDAETGETCGRGLSIVGAVADRWGARPTPTGKAVWAEVDLRRR